MPELETKSLEITRRKLVLKPPRVACLAMFLLIAAVQHGARAIEQRPGFLGHPMADIENCVGRDSIHFGSQGLSMVLDDADPRLVRAEMLRRYPVLASDGFPSSRTLLWQTPAGALIYIAVLDHPAKLGQACFSATFAAEKLDATLLLRRKYLAPDAAAR